MPQLQHFLKNKNKKKKNRQVFLVYIRLGPLSGRPGRSALAPGRLTTLTTGSQLISNSPGRLGLSRDHLPASSSAIAVSGPSKLQIFFCEGNLFKNGQRPLPFPSPTRITYIRFTSLFTIMSWVDGPSCKSHRGRERRGAGGEDAGNGVGRRAKKKKKRARVLRVYFRLCLGGGSRKRLP